MKLSTVKMIKLLVIILLLVLGHSYSSSVRYNSDGKTIDSVRLYLQRFFEKKKVLSVPQSAFSQNLLKNKHYEEKYAPINPLYKVYQSNVLPDPPNNKHIQSISSTSPNVYSEHTTDRILPDLLQQQQQAGEIQTSNVKRRHANSTDSERSQRKLRKEQKRLLRKANKLKREKKKEKRGMRWKQVLALEGAHHEIDGTIFGDCCPSEQIVLQKQVGKNRENHAVEIKPGLLTYERACISQVLGKECVFPSRTLRKGVKTRCAQYYSWSQTLVRAYQSDEPWYLDYVYVRAGCSCQVSPRKRKRKRKKRQPEIDNDVPNLDHKMVYRNETQ